MEQQLSSAPLEENSEFISFNQVNLSVSNQVKVTQKYGSKIWDPRLKKQNCQLFQVRCTNPRELLLSRPMFGVRVPSHGMWKVHPKMRTLLFSANQTMQLWKSQHNIWYYQKWNKRLQILEMSQCASKPEDWAGHPDIIHIVSSNTSIRRSHACYLKQVFWLLQVKK